MSWKTLAAILVLLAPLGAQSEDFRIRLSSFPKEAPQGAPVSVTIEICNASGHAITVARGHGGFGYVLSVRRADGLRRKGCKAPETASYILGFTSEVLPEDWRQVRTENITCEDDPGEWIVQARISCQGPYPIYTGGQQTGLFNAWNGTVVSEEAHIEITKPAGVDLEAFNAFNGCPRCDEKKLLERFPTSTYAGYALWSPIRPMTTNRLECLNDPDKALRDYAFRGGTEENTLAGIQQTLEDLRAYAKPLGLFLEAHPEFPHAQDLRKRYAMCLGLTGRMSDALVQIATLAKGTGKEADEAKAFLEARSTSAGKKP